MGAPWGSSEPLAAGPACAAALFLAAGLAELTAGLAGRKELVARARELGGKALALGREDAEAYAERLAGGGDAARERTIAVPGALAELAAELAELAAEAAAAGKHDSRYDAVAGALLAESAAHMAALLVGVNAGVEDGRARAARLEAERAAAAAQRALVDVDD
jgi:methenyltetrahydrofolate cyclohydrolase